MRNKEYNKVKMFQRITIIVASQSSKKGHFVGYLEKFPK